MTNSEKNIIIVNEAEVLLRIIEINEFFSKFSKENKDDDDYFITINESIDEGIYVSNYKYNLTIYDIRNIIKTVIESNENLLEENFTINYYGSNKNKDSSFNFCPIFSAKKLRKDSTKFKVYNINMELIPFNKNNVYILKDNKVIKEMNIDHYFEDGLELNIINKSNTSKDDDENTYYVERKYNLYDINDNKSHIFIDSSFNIIKSKSKINTIYSDSEISTNYYDLKESNQNLLIINFANSYSDEFFFRLKKYDTIILIMPFLNKEENHEDYKVKKITIDNDKIKPDIWYYCKNINIHDTEFIFIPLSYPDED